MIIGPGLVWRTDTWVARPEFSQVNQVKKGGSSSFDSAVRNSYKVLLTRGMQGMTLYSTDRKTQALLDTLMP